MKTYEEGTTLLELIIAVSMITVTVVLVSLIFPKASATVSNNRRHMLAVNFASARIQELKQQPYALLPVTNATAGNFPVSGTGANGCNCARENFSGIAVDTATVESGIAYTRKVCIHLVDRPAGVWTSYCPSADGYNTTDAGIKNIRVRVSWVAGQNNYFTDMESLVTRQ